jgi:hypothetical protein
MKKSFFKAIATVALTAFSAAHFAPVAEARTAEALQKAQAKKAAKASPLQTAVADYDKARKAYEQNGTQAFLKAFPAENFGKVDQRFFVEKAKGSVSFPDLVLQSEKLVLAKLPSGETVRFEVLDIGNSEFAINGQKFRAGKTLESTHKALLDAYAKSGGQKVSWNPWDWIVPNAHAMPVLAIVGIVLAAIALGIGIYYGVKYIQDKNYEQGYDDAKSGVDSRTGHSSDAEGAEGGTGVTSEGSAPQATRPVAPTNTNPPGSAATAGTTGSSAAPGGPNPPTNGTNTPN